MLKVSIPKKGAFAMEEFGKIAADAAMRAAAAYLQQHGLKADVDALTECIRSWVRIKLPHALHAAKEAFETGMDKAGEATFLAEMALAGIEAAKECGLPPALHAAR